MLPCLRFSASCWLQNYPPSLCPGWGEQLPCETFEFVPHDTGVKFLTFSQGMDAFSERVKGLAAAGRPVCLHVGCGTRIIDGFLNIDKQMYVPL